jgi:hypothetical protein
VKIWAVKGDAEQAVRYVTTLPQEHGTDAVKLSLISGISHAAPAEAWSVALQISDPSAQFRALKSALSVLAAQNPDHAERLLKSSSLSSSVSQRLGSVLEAVGKKS